MRGLRTARRFLAAMANGLLLVGSALPGCTNAGSLDNSMRLAATDSWERITDGNYGILNDHRNWTLTLRAKDSAETIWMKVELRDDAVYTHLLEMRLADGRNLPFSAPPIPVEAFRHGSNVRLAALVPVPEEFRKPYGHWQLVDIELVALHDRIEAKATTRPRSLQCKRCVNWTAHEVQHRLRPKSTNRG